MRTDLKTIDQSGIKAFLRERLEHPDRYASKPLVIWRSYFHDGINDSLIRDVLRDFNRGREKDDHISFMVNPKRARKDKLGLCVIDTMEDYSPTIAAYGDIPMAVYACLAEPDSCVSDKFPDADEYIFEPDLDMLENTFTRKFTTLVDFIRSQADRHSRPYLWYNYFNNDIRNISRRNGCDFPARWLDGLGKLRMHLKMARLKRLYDISENSFKSYFCPGISKDLCDEFYNYILTQKL